MITPQLMASIKSGMAITRAFTYSVEDVANSDSLIEAAKEMANLVGHVLYCQSVLAAKIAYEASVEEQKESTDA